MDLVKVRYTSSAAGINFTRPKGFEEVLPRNVADWKAKHGSVEIIGEVKTKPEKVEKEPEQPVIEAKAEEKQPETLTTQSKTTSKRGRRKQSKTSK